MSFFALQPNSIGAMEGSSATNGLFVALSERTFKCRQRYIPISSFSKSLDNRRKNLMKTKSAKNEFELDALMGVEYILPVNRCMQQQPDTHSSAKKVKTVSAIEHEAVCTANQDIAVELST